jgi:hypothetical protein
MTIADIDAQIAQLKARRAKLVAQHEKEREAQRAARSSERARQQQERQARLAGDRRALNVWVYFDEHGLPRGSVSLEACRRYAVLNGTKLAVVLFAAQSAGIPVERSEAPGDPNESPDAISGEVNSDSAKG